MKCNKCGFSNSSDASSCKNCGSQLAGFNPFQLNLEEQPQMTYYNCKSCAYTLPSTQTVCTKCGTDNSVDVVDRKKTIPFADFSFSKSGSSCKLVPVNTSMNEIPFKGTENIINRATIDESDLTISENVHATLENRDGRWYLKNGSSNSATFIQVTDATEIKHGTILILGQSKVFKFECD